MMYVLSMTKKRWLNLSVGLLLLGHSPSLLAASLGLSHDYPEIFTDKLQVSYTLTGSNTGLLTVSGSWGDINPTFSTFSYNDGSSAVFFDNVAPHADPAYAGSSGIYSLSATLDVSGALLHGDFSISGAISSIGITDSSTILLNGDLNAFGFAGSPNRGILDWTSTNVGGALAAGFGNDIGAILWIDASDFDSGLFNGVDMGNSFSAKRVIGNTFSITPVPLPAAAWLFICGLVGLMGLPRKIRRI